MFLIDNYAVLLLNVNMDFDNNDISKFLDQFEKENSEVERAFAAGKALTAHAHPQHKMPARANPAEESFKKLEEKVSELERKFEVSVSEKAALERELKNTKEDVEKQKSKEEFFNNIASTIANLKESVDRMSAARPAKNEVYGAGYYYGAPINQAAMYGGAEPAYMQAAAALEKQNKIIEEQAVELKNKDEKLTERSVEIKKAELERAEQEKTILSLKEKTSRLKAVNMALDKEFKRVQEEKVEALRKSAEQAKEILSLREQLSAAEERFKSFDFEGRIISVQNKYEERVAGLETQLEKMSAVCMKQVEEIENLKTENLSYQNLKAEYDQKVAELEALRVEINKISAAQPENERNVLLKAQTLVQQAQKEAKDQVARVSADLQAKDAARGKEMSRRIAAIAGEADKKEAELSRRLNELLAEKTALEAKLASMPDNTAAITQERQKFEKLFKDLTEKIRSNDKVIGELKSKIDVLTSENQNLKAAPEKNAPLTAEVLLNIAAPGAEAQPAPQAAPAQAQQAPQAAPARTQHDAAAARNAQRAARKQAEPEEERDFLADTQSFVGRLRWSILKDD